jgi:hypothetical protein
MADFSREINHNPDAFWNSTGLKVWNQVMGPELKFDNIAWSDLEGGNSIQLMSDFCQRCKCNPPISQITKAPYAGPTLQQALGAVVRKLQVKFGSFNENKEIFYEADVRHWKKVVKGDLSRNLMEAAEESDLFKAFYPIPREQSAKSAFLPFDIRNHRGRSESCQVSMKMICKEHFQRSAFDTNLKLQFTFSGIGRGGEVKFLTYNKWFFCETYNTLFVQWFQRKILKTNPSAFVPDFDCPEMCIWLGLGCYWACCDGLARPEGIGPENSALRRKSAFVFQDLHHMQDGNVVKTLTTAIRSV